MRGKPKFIIVVETKELHNYLTEEAAHCRPDQNLIDFLEGMRANGITAGQVMDAVVDGLWFNT